MEADRDKDIVVIVAIRLPRDTPTMTWHGVEHILATNTASYWPVAETWNYEQLVCEMAVLDSYSVGALEMNAMQAAAMLFNMSAEKMRRLGEGEDRVDLTPNVTYVGGPDDTIGEQTGPSEWPAPPDSAEGYRALAQEKASAGNDKAAEYLLRVADEIDRLLDEDKRKKKKRKKKKRK